MTRIADRTVLFADLRGSTALFESLGNAQATEVVTTSVTALSSAIIQCEGRVVKTLGDGLMAVFEEPVPAVKASRQMHEAIESIVARGRRKGASVGLRVLRLQVAIAHGEVVEMGSDCFGDAVNVAARLIDHAGDNETLATAEVLSRLPQDLQQPFRSIDRIVLRGRAEPVSVHASGGRRASDDEVTAFGAVDTLTGPDGVKLTWKDRSVVMHSPQMPLVLGRSPQTTFCVDDPRVSRSHARIDWHGGSFQLTDLSYNGTYVQFGDGEMLPLRRGSCTLHGTGLIGLGGTPADPTTANVRFEILRQHGI